MKNNLVIGLILIATILCAVVVVLHLADQAVVTDLPATRDAQSAGWVDPNDIVFQRADAFEHGLTRVAAMATDGDNNIYVAGSIVASQGPAENQLKVFTSAGRPVRTEKIASPATAILVAGDKTVYVAVGDHLEIFRHGDKSSSPKFEGKPAITGLAMIGGQLCVADSGNFVVWRCDMGGRTKSTIAHRDESKNYPGPILPSPYLRVVAGSDGLLRINNPGMLRVESWSANGQMKSSFGASSSGEAKWYKGFGGCCNPVGLAIMSDDSLVVADKQPAIVKLYSPAGDFAGVIATTEQLGFPTDAPLIAADSQGRVLLAGAADGKITILVRKLGVTTRPENAK